MAGEADRLSEQDAKQRGSYIHLLLEHLPSHPKSERDNLAKGLLPSVNQAEFTSIYKEVTAVLDNPDLAFIFNGDALAEAPISANLPELGGARIHGEIDRLLISPTRILVVDFKSNAIVPITNDAVPDELLRQLGAYCAALEQIFPNHTVETAILWTRTATLMALERKAVTAALRSTTLP